MNLITRRLSIIAVLLVTCLAFFNFFIFPTSVITFTKTEDTCSCPEVSVSDVNIPFTAGLLNGAFVSFSKETEELDFRVNPKFQYSSCPTSLQRKVIESNWFREKYRPDIHLLTNKNKLNTYEYNRLMPYWMPFGYKYHENVTEKDLYDVYKEFPVEESIFTFAGKSRPPCISCAVVGTGGVLNGSNMGKEIDSHDMVFRVNNAVRKGYEKDVGVKLTHYIFFDRSLTRTSKDNVPTDEGTIYVFMPCRKADLDYLLNIIGKGTSTKKQKLSVKSESLRILHPDFVRYIHKVWENTKSFRPTTGGMMLMTALHGGCDHVSIYGMGYTYDYSMHYYDKDYVKYDKVTGSHDYQREIALMHQLHKDGVVRWYKRDIAQFS